MSKYVDVLAEKAVQMGYEAPKYHQVSEDELKRSLVSFLRLYEARLNKAEKDYSESHSENDLRRVRHYAHTILDFLARHQNV